MDQEINRPCALHHLVLEVSDLDRSLQFYQEVLGLRALPPEPWAEDGPTAVVQTDGGEYLVLVQVPTPRPQWEGACAQFTLSPERWPTMRAQLDRFGHREIVDPKGGLRANGELRVRLRDPDGYALELRAFEPSFYEVPAAGRGKVTAGRIDDFAVGSVTRIAQGKFYLVRLAEGFLAISEVCTHRQFTVTYQPEHHRFYCPLHGNRYSRTGRRTRVGAREESPPLHVYPIEFVDGCIVVDTDRSLPRTAEEADRLVPTPRL